MKIYIYIITLEGVAEFYGELDDQNMPPQAFEDLLRCFSYTVNEDSKIIEFPCRQQKHYKCIENIKKFIQKYGEVLKYDSKQLLLCFERMHDSEPFDVIPSKIELTQDQINTIAKELEDSLPEDKKKIRNELRDIVNKATAIYDIIPIDTDSMSKFIGEKDKSKRVCRFCRKSKPYTSFENKAHAISKSLGNYNIILNEECDTCNNLFSNLEKQFIDFLKYYKISHGIFDSESSIRSEGCNLNNDGKKAFRFNIQKSTNNLQNNSMHIEATAHFFDTTSTFPKIQFPDLKIVPQNIYKVLCKYALSIIKEKATLPPFSETIEWMIGITSKEKLPLVGISVNAPIASKPSLILHIRKALDTKYPKAIAIFVVGHVSFLYAIPVDGESVDFESFFEINPLYKKASWEWLDFSSCENKTCHFSITFSQKNK